MVKMRKEIYLDSASTTPVSKNVVEEMNKVLLENYGNPSSVHAMGEKAAKIMNNARERLAKEINSKNHEIIFTSGATESNNIALRNIDFGKGKNKIIISYIEHPSIEETARFLERERKFKIVRVPVNSLGIVNLDFLKKEIDSKTALVSIMHVNNIIGSIQPIDQIGKLCKDMGVLFHTDAVQSFGKLNIDVRKMNLGMLSASGHKIGGPKGIGLIYVKEGLNLKPWTFGGGQEKGIRSGTENVSGIVGFAKALDVQKRIDKNKIKKVRDRLAEKIKDIGGKLNSSDEGIYNIIHASFKEIDSDNLVQWLSQRRIYVSAGSACENKKKSEDNTLKAIGLSHEQINGSIRFSLSENINEKDVDFIIGEIELILKKLKV